MTYCHLTCLITLVQLDNSQYSKHCLFYWLGFDILMAVLCNTCILPRSSTPLTMLTATLYNVATYYYFLSGRGVAFLPSPSMSHELREAFPSNSPISLLWKVYEIPMLRCFDISKKWIAPGCIVRLCSFVFASSSDQLKGFPEKPSHIFKYSVIIAWSGI